MSQSDTETEIKKICVSYKVWKNLKFFAMEDLTVKNVKKEIDKTFKLENIEIPENDKENISVDKMLIKHMKNKYDKEEIFVEIEFLKENYKPLINFKWPKILIFLKDKKKDEEDALNKNDKSTLYDKTQIDSYCLTLMNETDKTGKIESK
jgi:hypothetical protein